MPPIQSNPFVHAIRMLLMRYNSYYLSKKSKSTYKLHPQKKRAPNKPIIDMKPLNTLFQGLSSTIKQITKKPEREDYNALIKSFLPQMQNLLFQRVQESLKIYTLQTLMEILKMN